MGLLFQVGKAFRDALERRRPDELEPGGLPFAQLYPSSPGSVGLRRQQANTVRTFTGSGASQVIAPANAARHELTIYNGSGVTAYIVQGSIASSSAGGYTIALATGSTYILEEPDCYAGDVAALWASGALEVTERAYGV